MYVFEKDIKVGRNTLVGLSTPSAWSSNSRVVELARPGSALWGLTGAEYLALSCNNYYTGTVFKYANTAAAGLLELDSNKLIYYNAPSGTLGNDITWQQRFHIDANGNLGASVSPSAHSTTRMISLEMGAAGNYVGGSKSGDTTEMCNNAYYDGTNWKYARSAAASLSQCAAGYVYSYSAASGTAGNNITWTLVTAVSKGLTFTLEGATVSSGTGISFPATQNPSTNPNVLDDYEENTWTPTVTAGSGSFTTVSATGTYVKVGRKVSFAMSIVITNAGSATNALLATLPFTNGGERCALAAAEFALTGWACSGVIGAGGTGVYITKYDGSSIIASGRTVDIAGTYFV